MRRPLVASSLALLSLAASCSAPAPAPTPVGTATAAVSAPEDAWYVVLEARAAARAIPAGVDPRSAQATVAVRAQLARIEAQQGALLPAIAQYGGKPMARLSRLANVIQVLATDEAIERIALLPGVLRVERVPRLERSLASAVPLVGAPDVWAPPLGIRGDGVTIGIIDSGIDYTHADFAGAGTEAAYLANDPDVIEDGSFPTARVVGGWDFVGDDYNPDGASPVPKPDGDPLDCTKPENSEISGGHGTHVAGIAAGNGVLQAGLAFAGPYDQSLDPAAFRVYPGVAPGASLMAFKVFGCDGSTNMLAAALDRAADPNQDGNFDDRVDVVNASLGTSYGLGSPTNDELIKNLTDVGTLMVVAAGNSGQSFFCMGAPGSAPEVLSVAASADNQFVTLTATGQSGTAEYASAEGGFTARLLDIGPVSGALVATNPALGCSPLANAADVAGKVALIDRGTCPFVQKFDNAVAAGALAVIVVDNDDDALPFAMAGGDPGQYPIVGVMVTQADGNALKASLAAGPVTVGLDPDDPYLGLGAELLAGFSARGPSPVDGRLKPEIAAPGFAIDSARVGSGTEPRRSQGTSMASPMVAGAAALVRQARPELSPYQVKASLMNSALPLLDLESRQYATSFVGAGRLDVARSVAQPLTAATEPGGGEVGVAFGAIVAATTATVKRSITVENHGAAAVTVDAAIEATFPQAGLVLSIDPATLSIPAGGTAATEVTLVLDPEALGAPEVDPGTAPVQGGMNPTPRHFLNEASGVVRFTPQGGGPDLAVPYSGSLRAGSSRRGAAPVFCAPEWPSGQVAIALDGASAHPDPTVSAFQLGVLDEVEPESATDPNAAVIDVRAVGVADNRASGPSDNDAMIYFGVAVEGTWTTPARGPLSVILIEIDSSGTSGADYAIRVEPRNPSFGFRDALVASPYSLTTGERGERQPINVVGPDVAKTQPFFNSVLVLPALFDDIGVDPQNPDFRYRVSTEDPVNLVIGDRTDWVDFTPTTKLIDTALHGYEGTPLTRGAGPVLVEVTPEAATLGAPLDVLLLHHNNVEGKRWEVVSLGPRTPGNLAVVASSAVSALDAGAEAVVDIAVRNDGTETIDGVMLNGSVLGGEVVSAEPPQGTCGPGPSLTCALGKIEPATILTIPVTVRAGAEGESIRVQAVVQGELPCDTTAEDNSTALNIAIHPAQETRPPPAATGGGRGGCGCRVDGGSAADWRAAALAGAVALLGARRRRRAR
ncbi:MAG: S8 family serine peptidase [Polyangiaceae bacterium]